MNSSNRSTPIESALKEVRLFGANGKMGQIVQQLLKEDAEFRLAIDGCDAILDFSSPDGLLSAIKLALELKVPLVSGTTGLGSQHFEALQNAAKKIPVLHSPNFSIGIATLFSLAEQLRHLPAEFSIRETHHVHKKDAPSGTALKLQNLIGDAPISWERTGEVMGEHELVIRFAHEELTIKHSVYSRKTFAEGALVALKFLIGKQPGYYSFNKSVIDL